MRLILLLNIYIQVFVPEGGIALGPHSVGEAVEFSRRERVLDPQALVEWDHRVLPHVAMVGLVGPVT